MFIEYWLSYSSGVRLPTLTAEVTSFILNIAPSPVRPTSPLASSFTVGTLVTFVSLKAKIE